MEEIVSEVHQRFPLQTYSTYLRWQHFSCRSWKTSNVFATVAAAWKPGTCKMSVKCVHLSLQQYLCQKCSSKQSCLLEVPGMFKSILDLLRANLVVLERRWLSCELVRKRDVQVGCEGWNSKKFQCLRNYRIRKDWAAASKSSSVRMSRRWIQTETSFFAECIGRPWSDSSHRNLASTFDPLPSEFHDQWWVFEM